MPSLRRLLRSPLRRSSALLFVAVPLLAACGGDDTPTGTGGNTPRYGSLAIIGTRAGDSVIATPRAVFFSGVVQEVPDSRTTTDRCAITPLDLTPSNPLGDLLAGASLSLDVRGAQSASLAMPREAGTNAYALAVPGTFRYTAGDSVRLTVPGATDGFPASGVAVRLAEPVRLGPVAQPASNQPFRFTWAPDGDANSGIILSLRFREGATGSVPTTQVLCILRDDGAYDVPATLLTEYLQSPSSFRSLQVTRWRTNFSQVDARTLLHVLSSADTTLALAGL